MQAIVIADEHKNMTQPKGNATESSSWKYVMQRKQTNRLTIYTAYTDEGLGYREDGDNGCGIDTDTGQIKKDREWNSKRVKVRSGVKGLGSGHVELA
jgi:hypothetical protein